MALAERGSHSVGMLVRPMWQSRAFPAMPRPFVMDCELFGAATLRTVSGWKPGPSSRRTSDASFAEIPIVSSNFHCSQRKNFLLFFLALVFGAQ